MNEGYAFEDDVRRVARQLWPNAQFGGATKLAGRERDAVFYGEDVVHVIECTISRKKDKAVIDIDKISKIAKQLRQTHPDKHVTGWFITQQEPTADQRSVADKYKREIKIIVCSFETFRRRLVDAHTYLDLREKYRFGSIWNPSTNTYNISTDEYIEMDILDTKNGKSYSVGDLLDETKYGKKLLIVGDYGAGKSMTLRQMFFALKQKYSQKTTARFPLYINLRDHHGQKNPAEAIIRHADLIGYPDGHQLIRAWRAGYIDLLLDGFDELATAGWLVTTKKLKQIRHEAMTLVREIVMQSPADIAVVLTGRKHYFDNDTEMRNALGIPLTAIELSLSDFSEEQVREFLDRKGLKSALPTWLPSRPLLIGYLAANKIITAANISEFPDVQAEGWTFLLRKICEREATIAATLDAATIQEVLERIATICRSKSDGLGPVFADEIYSAFRDVVGYPPDDTGQMLLMRLPGLGPEASDDGSRRFVDNDLADAARAGDLVRYIFDPFNFPIQHISKAVSSLGSLGTSVAALNCSEAKHGENKLSVAAEKAGQARTTMMLAADIINVMQEGAWSYVRSPICISEEIIDRVRLLEMQANFSKVTYSDCIVTHLEIDAEVQSDYLPSFQRCSFYFIDGRVSMHDLPRDVFSPDCTFEDFTEARTTSQILSLEIAEGIRVLLTVLKKLFVQPGSGRRESAFFRGLDHRQRRLVPDVLSLVQSEKIALKTRMHEQIVWLPARSQTARVQKILAAPSVSNDALVQKAATID